MLDMYDDLLATAAEFGTPVYVYDMDAIVSRIGELRSLFQGQFGISYAIKANPNLELLRRMASHVQTFDASSYQEVVRARSIGCAASRITFSGPAKRKFELAGAVADRIGEIVLESVAEADAVNEIAAGKNVIQRVLIRINPTNGPKKYGVSFSGRASQFGIDEEVLGEAIRHVADLPHLELAGFHAYTGTNSLDIEALEDNFSICIDLFRRAAEATEQPMRKLIFGAGFGVPYGENDAPLNLPALAAGIVPKISALREEARFRGVECLLELGRWIVAPAGWLLTSVVSEKLSRGTEFRLCDAGFNNHLAACGMMGTVIRRNWRIKNVSNAGGEKRKYTLVGPLCTSIDVLASGIHLPETRVGDILAVENSGAYGLTASPTRFISHPEPAEVMISGGQAIEVSEDPGSRPRPLRAPE
jgi:diaminopimelate decarboxylase